MLGLVAANAFFVAAEYAIVTARRAPLMARAAAGSRGAEGGSSRWRTSSRRSSARSDEYGLPEAALRRLDGGVVEVAGSMTIDDFNETLGTHLPQPGVRTLAGLVFDRLGRLPAVGDSATIDDVQLRVHATEGPRITAPRITVPQQDARPASGE